MRKTLIGVLVTALLGVATPVAAEEITMICKYRDETRTLKYVNPMIGKRKILQRWEGEWVSLGSSSEDHHRPPQLTITERGAVLKTVTKLVADKNYKTQVQRGMFSYILTEDEPYLRHSRYVLDFEFITHGETQYLTTMAGRGLNKGAKGLDPDKPDRRKWKCKKRRT